MVSAIILTALIYLINNFFCCFLKHYPTHLCSKSNNNRRVLFLQTKALRLSVFSRNYQSKRTVICSNLCKVGDIVPRLQIHIFIIYQTQPDISVYVKSILLPNGCSARLLEVLHKAIVGSKRPSEFPVFLHSILVISSDILI